VYWIGISNGGLHYVLWFYPDGNTHTVNYYPNGLFADETWNTRFPDGTLHSHVLRPDGTGLDQWTYPDGSRYSRHVDLAGNLHETWSNPDGHSFTQISPPE
jgi:hypothetical protein